MQIRAQSIVYAGRFGLSAFLILGAVACSSADSFMGVGDGDGAGGDGDGNSNVAFGGAQDMGYFRAQLDAGEVPQPGDFSAAGFFAEHHTVLPEPDCGERICLQTMVGAMGNMAGTGDCVMLQLGLNSPVTVDESDRPPLNLGVVVDTSGSMSAEGKMEFVRQGLNILVDELLDTDTLSIIAYDNTVDVLVEPTTVAGNRGVFRDAIEMLQAQGGTNLHDGLEAGFQTLLGAYDAAGQNRVILLSDGQASHGITSTPDILEMSAGYNTDGIGLTSVGLGTAFNIELMQGLSEQADGNFYFVENPAAVEEVFAEELAYFTVPVAFDLELRMETGADYSFGRALGAPTWEDTATGGELNLASVFLAHRTSHDDIGEGGGRRGGGSALVIELNPRDDDGSDIESGQMASARLSYWDPVQEQKVNQLVNVSYPFAPWAIQSTGYFQNPVVEKSFVMYNIYIALEDATAMFHSGFDTDAIEAVDVLHWVADAAADYEDSANEGEGDEDIVGDIALINQLIDVIEQNGIASEFDEDDVVDDPWPAD